MKSTKINIQSLFSTHYFLLIIFSFPLLFNLFRPGFYSSDDGQWMAIRLTAFHESFRSGQIPVRWMSRLNHEYGYPVTNFLYPLPFYLAEPFYVLSGDPVLAIKIIMGLSVISMAFGSFVLFKRWGTIAGAAGALAYVYSPYIAYNLYTRGSLGELAALGIVPWIFWALSHNRFLLSSIFIAGLITAHNVVAAVFLPLIVFYNIYNNYPAKQDPALRGKNYKIQAVSSLILALVLSSFFWLPALYEYRFVRASQISVSDFGNEYLSLQKAFQRTGPVSVLANFGLPLFFLTENSKWFWDLFKPLQIIQFPWRFLSLFAFSSSTVVALLIYVSRKNRFTQYSFITFIIFISASSFLSPKSFIDLPPSYYQTNDDSTTVRSEYTPVWVKNLPLNRSEFPVKHFYPGLKLFVNGIEQPANLNSDNGELKPLDSRDNNRIKFIWSEAPLRVIADLISVTGLLTVLFLFKRQQYKY
ncbi:hypothetical protein HZB78_05240 [Candidatus Collierbacteria bacterium]|nr:hypothetical protein [Candidatus Collierbacteria bacterium]